jgi:hypothetical protein
MRIPNVFSIDGLRSTFDVGSFRDNQGRLRYVRNLSTAEIPAPKAGRPKFLKAPKPHRPNRWSAAWMVLTGRADALVWPGDR